ncbi:MAG TPA: hypothetical protein DCY07_01120 [Rhodospirillaceae bacterium]|nr:hypothetical protein [Rhodospirillaceae bacterium]
MVYKDVPNGKDVKGIKALKAEITACKKNYSNPQDQANCADFAKSAIDAIYKAKALGLNTTSTVVYANQSKAPDAANAITDNQEIAHIQADKKKVKHYTSLCKAQLGPVALKTKTADFSDRVHQLMFEVSPERVEKPFGRIQVGEQLKN